MCSLMVDAAIMVVRASDFPFQKREIPFRFRFIIAKIELDEIPIYPKKYSIESKLSLDHQDENIKTEKQWFH